MIEFNIEFIAVVAAAFALGAILGCLFSYRAVANFLISNPVSSEVKEYGESMLDPRISMDEKMKLLWKYRKIHNDPIDRSDS